MSVSAGTIVFGMARRRLTSGDRRAVCGHRSFGSCLMSSMASLAHARAKKETCVQSGGPNAKHTVESWPKPRPFLPKPDKAKKAPGVKTLSPSPV